MYYGSTNDFHAYPFAVHGYFYWRAWAIAKALCSQGDTVVEVGANVGTETLGFADLVGCSGRVYAFEPLPANVERLQEQISHQSCDNITLMPVAVGAREETIYFSVSEDPHASGQGFVTRELNDHTIEIRCVMLDSYIDEFKKASFLFMDVEGSELNVLRGAGLFLKTFSPAIVLEAGQKQLAKTGTTLEELYGQLLSPSVPEWVKQLRTQV